MYLFFISALAWSPCYGDWKSDANARIESIRKRDARITVIDSEGYPVPGVDVQIEQIKHRFAFGTGLTYPPLSSNSTYRNFVLDHYEWAVCGNEMKWGSNEAIRDVETYVQADYIANWCADNGLILRGHNVIWETGAQQPSWVSGLDCETYPTNSEMLEEIDERINSVVGRYAGQIVQWDINNEMLSGNEYGCFGEAGRAHMFTLANSIDPDCLMMMNEYAGNSFGGYDGDAYASRARGLIALGAPVEGLGIQAHISAPFDPERYYNNVLQELAVLGLPIMATEFDYREPNVNLRADGLEDFYRICFSHPNVQGIIQWGFWDGDQWREDAQLVELDWTINAAGQRYLDLMDEWTTSDSGTTDDWGDVYFRGFHGTYEITLSVPGQPVARYTIELEPGETTEEFVLPGLLAWDDFESGGWTGGDGWSGDWSHSGDSTVTTDDTPYEGNYHLRLRGTSIATRTVDMTGITNAHLTFYWKARSFEGGETVTVKVYDGSSHTVLTVINGQDDNTYHPADIDLSSYNMTSDFQIEVASSMSTSDYFYIDYIGVTGSKWLYGDLTYDNRVDMNDLPRFCKTWLVPDCNNVKLDLNGDCVINFYEYAFFAQNWLEEVE
jgi:GH35 family endo-1,4-beta-xylanase